MPFEIDTQIEEAPQVIKVIGVGGGGEYRLVAPVLWLLEPRTRSQEQGLKRVFSYAVDIIVQ